MNTGAKIAIGCGALVVLSGVVAVVGIVGFGFWAKGKADAMQAELKKVSELSEKADAIPFTEPADGILSEDRLVKFLAVRKRLFPLYEKHKAGLEQLQQSQNQDKNNPKQPDLSDVSRMVGAIAIMNELQQVHLQALIDEGMSRSEYRYHVQAVYKTMWAAELRKATGGKTAGQATGEGMKQAARALEEQARATPDPSLPPEAQAAMRQAQEQARQQAGHLEQQADHAAQQLEEIDNVPEQNLALFRKYEAEIKQYAMTGLELLAL